MAGKPKRGRQQDYALVDADLYAPADGVGVKADEPEPPKYAKVTLIVEDDEKTTTLVVSEARVTTELVPDPVDEARLRRLRREDVLSGEVRLYQPPKPGLFKVEIRPHPDEADGTWGRVEIRKKPTEKETDR